MCKSAMNRHHHGRVMRRRLTYFVWAWAKDNPKYRNMAARNTVPCSCWMCRDHAVAHKEFAERRAVTIEGNIESWR